MTARRRHKRRIEIFLAGDSTRSLDLFVWVIIDDEQGSQGGLSFSLSFPRILVEVWTVLVFSARARPFPVHFAP